MRLPGRKLPVAGTARTRPAIALPRPDGEHRCGERGERGRDTGRPVAGPRPGRAVVPGAVRHPAPLLRDPRPRGAGAGGEHALRRGLRAGAGVGPWPPVLGVRLVEPRPGDRRADPRVVRAHGADGGAVADPQPLLPRQRRAALGGPRALPRQARGRGHAHRGHGQRHHRGHARPGAGDGARASRGAPCGAPAGPALRDRPVPGRRGDDARPRAGGDRPRPAGAGGRRCSAGRSRRRRRHRAACRRRPARPGGPGGVRRAAADQWAARGARRPHRPAAALQVPRGGAGLVGGHPGRVRRDRSSRVGHPPVAGG